jgi:DNA-binding CsgD family transcriptional regulator
LLHELEKSAEELLLVKTDSERFLTEKESEIHSLQKSLSLYQGNSLNLEQWEDEREFLSCDLINHFHDMSSRTQMATATELDRLLDVAQKAFPKLYSTVTDSSHGLSHTEIIICVLIRFRFIPSEISILLGHSSQRITNLKSSINQKLFGTSGAKTLDAHLIALK